MALKIRLRQQGRKNRRSYRLVLADSRSPRDGKYLENLGHYDPRALSDDNATVDHERLVFWLDKGAQLTERAKILVARAAPEVYRNIVNRDLEKKEKQRIKAKARRKA